MGRARVQLAIVVRTGMRRLIPPATPQPRNTESHILRTLESKCVYHFLN